MSEQQDQFFNNPRIYYAYLRSQGVQPVQAAQMTQQRYPSSGHTAKDTANKQQWNTVAAGVGTVGGAIAANELTKKENWQWAFSNNNTTPTGQTINGSTGIAQTNVPAYGATYTNVTSPQNTQWNANANAAVQQNTLASSGYKAGDALPGGAKVQSVNADVATIQTPQGTTQQVPTETLSQPDFWQRVNWDDVAQGGLGLYQMYTGYNQWKNDDKFGGGANMAAGAANVAAATGAIGTASGTAGAYLVPGLNLVAGAYGGYKTAEALGDMGAGAERNRTGVVGGATSGAAIGGAIGSIVPGVGTAAGAAVGAVVGGIAGLVGSLTGSHKKNSQIVREKVRDTLRDAGVLDQDFNIYRADGTKYSLANDKPYKKWDDVQKIIDTNPNAWNAATPAADTLSAFYGFYGKNRPNITVMYANAAISNANDNPEVAIKNMQAFAKQQGITYELVKSKFDKALEDGDLDQRAYDKFMGGATALTGGPNAQQQILSGQQSPSQQPAVLRPQSGEVIRVSPGMYRNDKGKLVSANSMRSALEKAYTESSKTKHNKNQPQKGK